MVLPFLFIFILRHILSDVLNLLAAAIAFVYGYVEVGDGGFGAGVAGDGVIAETTEDGDLIESSAHDEFPSGVRFEVLKVPISSGRSPGLEERVIPVVVAVWLRMS